MQALAPLVLLPCLAACAYGLDVGNTTTYITLWNKNAYGVYGVGSYAPEKENLTLEQCRRSCSEDPRCDCATQKQGATADSKRSCWRHDSCDAGGFVSDYNKGYNVYMQVVTPWHLQGLAISEYASFAAAAAGHSALHIAESAGLNTSAFAAISRDTVSAFTIRSRSAAKMSLASSAAPDGLDAYAVELLANGTVSIPGHGLHKFSWEAGVSLRIEPGQPWQVVADLGYKRLPLAGVMEVDALHAKVALSDAGGSVDVLEVRPRQHRQGSTAANVTTLSYATLWNKNAFPGFGGEPLRLPDRRDGYLSARACQARCSQESLCDCVTWERSTKRCWLRKDCRPKQMTSNWNKGYNVYMKVRTEWLQEGTSYSSNRFFKAVAASTQPAFAASHTPLQSFTVSVGWRGSVGLSTSAALDSDFADGYFVNVSSGAVSVSLQGAGAMQLPYEDGWDIQLFAEGGEVFVQFPNSKDKLQYLLGPSPGAIYAKFVLWEAGSSVSVRNLTAYEPPSPHPTSSPSQGTSSAEGGWQVALFVSMGVLLAISLVATLAVVRWRRRRSNVPDIVGPSLGTPEVAPMPVLLGCTSRTRSNGLVATSMESKRMSNPAYAAISLEQLSDLRERAKKVLGRDFKAATMHDVSSKVLRPLCARHGLCYAHYVNSSKPLRASVFVSHAWQENFDEFVTSVQGAFSHWTVKPNLWICATALLQAPAPTKTLTPLTTAPSLQAGSGEDPSKAPFIQALAEASFLLVVRNSTVDLFDRIWCCWELYCAHKQGLLQKPGSLMVVGPQKLGGAPTVDVAEASSFDLEDKRRILLHILQESLLPEVNQFLTGLAFRKQEEKQAEEQELGMALP